MFKSIGNIYAVDFFRIVHESYWILTTQILKLNIFLLLKYVDPCWHSQFLCRISNCFTMIIFSFVEKKIDFLKWYVPLEIYRSCICTANMCSIKPQPREVHANLKVPLSWFRIISPILIFPLTEWSFSPWEYLANQSTSQPMQTVLWLPSLRAR